MNKKIDFNKYLNRDTSSIPLNLLLLIMNSFVKLFMFKKLKQLYNKMIKGGKGGKNTLTGLKFESRVDINKLFERLKGYVVKDNNVFFEKELVAKIFKKDRFYKEFLEPYEVNFKELLSKKLKPDQVVFVINTTTIYIIEIKFQRVEGSVDEKLQTCDFKKKTYQKLVSKLNMKVEYVYVLNNWFKKEKYRDTLEYVKSVGCHYFFNEIPLSFLGLPVNN